MSLWLYRRKQSSSSGSRPTHHPEHADFLAQHRELGRRLRKATPRHAQIRWFVVPKFHNYLIIYLPHQETIMVVRVLHAAHDWTRFFPASQNPPS